MTRKDWYQLAKGLSFISPWLVGFVGLTLLPIGLSLYYSFCDHNAIQRPLWVGTSNYRQLAGDNVFWNALRVNFTYALIAIPSSLLASLTFAMLLNAKIRGQAIYRTIIVLPHFVPAIASAMLWLWLFNAKLGLINVLLGKVGIRGPGWLAEPAWMLPALALMAMWGVGYSVIIYLAGLQDVPRELYEAAEIDGAGSWGRLWHVTLPMISPVIFFNLVMALIGILAVFDIPQAMFQGGGPDRSAYFYGMYLYDKAFIHFRMGEASAMAWVQLIIVLVLTGLVFWSSRKWVHYQGK